MVVQIFDRWIAEGRGSPLERHGRCKSIRPRRRNPRNRAAGRNADLSPAIQARPGQCNDQRRYEGGGGNWAIRRPVGCHHDHAIGASGTPE